MLLRKNFIPGRLLILVILLCITELAAAQADSLFQLDKEVRAEAMIKWAIKQKKKDSVKVEEVLRQIQQKARKDRDDILRQQTIAALVYYKSSALDSNAGRGDAIIKEAIDKAVSDEDYFAAAALNVYLGFRLAQIPKWEAAFVHTLRGHELFEKYGYYALPDGPRPLYMIGSTYYLIHDHDRASHFMRLAAVHPSVKKLGMFEFNMLNTLGLSLHRSHQLDSAIRYYQFAYDDAVARKIKYWPHLIRGNIGQAYFENGQPDRALPLMLEDYTESIRVGEYGPAANAAQTLTSIYLQKGNLEEASKYLEFARVHWRPDDEPFMEKFYNNSFAYYKAIGSWNKAALYADSAIAQALIVQQLNDESQIDHALLKVKVEQHTSEMKHLEGSRKRQVFLRNGALLVMGLVTIILLQFIQRQQFRRKNERMLSTLNERIAKEELDNARAQLISFTRSLSEKNELIDAIKNELAEVRLLDQHESHERADRLNQLLQSTILTDEDWAGFRINFEKVFPGFFVGLREKMPDLTPADTRLLALTKLHLSTKEMAGILGISTESIKKSRQRLRRRLNLPEEGSLDELVADL